MHDHLQQGGARECGGDEQVAHHVALVAHEPHGHLLVIAPFFNFSINYQIGHITY